MNDKTLRVIGRAHTAQQVEEAYAMARTAKIHHINMDVIAGLPGENIDDFSRTMDAALRLKPESLTVHTLAIKRSSRLHLENAPLPDGETASRMVQLGLETAHRLGMKPYYLYRQKYMAGNQENVGYALPGHACQYNVDIMEETTHILALGRGRAFPNASTRRKGTSAARRTYPTSSSTLPAWRKCWAQKSTFPAGNATLTAKSTFRRRQIPLLACNLAHLLIQ